MRPAPTTARGATGSVARLALVAAVLATLGSLAYAGLRSLSVEVPDASVPKPWNVFTDQLQPPANRLEAMANIADGQAFVALARDPFAREPAHFYDGAPELVYRAQRPLGGWAVAVLSAGRPGAMPVALLVVTCLGVGGLAAASVVAAAREGKPPRFGLLTLLLPGVFLSVVLLVPEPLPAALALAGLVLWRDGRHRGWAVVAFALAVLGRELLVLVPLALAANEVVIDRRRIRDVAALALPIVPYALWVLSLRQRYGLWPGQQTELGRGGLPFTGWIEAADHMELLVIVSYVIAAVLLALALLRYRRSPYTWGAVAIALSSILLGENVLSTESYRPMLGMYVLALIIVLPPLVRGRRRSASAPTGA